MLQYAIINVASILDYTVIQNVTFGLERKVLYKSIEYGLNHDLHPLKTYNGSQEYFKHQERNVCAKIFLEYSF